MTTKKLQDWLNEDGGAHIKWLADGAKSGLVVVTADLPEELRKELMPSGETRYFYIYCQNQYVFLDDEGLKDETFKVAQGSVSAECEGCQSDISETGELIEAPEGRAVKCTHCDSLYYVQSCTKR